MEYASCCCIVIPRHHSVLSSTELLPKGAWWRRLAVAVSSGTDQDGSNINATSSADADNYFCNVLILQCHAEGVMWRGLAPLLMLPEEAGNSSFDSSMMPQSVESLNVDVANPNPSTEIETAEKRSENDDDGHPGSERVNNTHQKRKKEACNNKSSSCCALSLLLMNHFQNRMRMIALEDDKARGDSDHGSSNDKQTCNGDNNNDTHLNSSHFTENGPNWSVMMQCYNNYDVSSNNSKSRRDNNITIPTILLLLPPNPYYKNNLQYYSRTSSTSPTNLFAKRLIHNENTYIRLTSLSAYISTLGGGFFLCRYLSTAVSLARQQCHLAYLRGDTDMVLKCRINEGYCYIHAGKLNRGKKVIRRVLRDVMQMQMEKGMGDTTSGGGDGNGELLLYHTPERELDELTIIRNMCHSALRFADLIRREADGNGSSSENVDEDENNPNPDTNGSVNNNGGIKKEKIISTTHDDFQRIRIVQDRKLR